MQKIIFVSFKRLDLIINDEKSSHHLIISIQGQCNCIVSFLEELKFHRVGVNLQKAMKCSRMAFRFILLLSVYLSGAEDSLGKRRMVQKVWEVLKGKIAILGDTMTDDTTSELLIQKH